MHLALDTHAWYAEHENTTTTFSSVSGKWVLIWFLQQAYIFPWIPVCWIRSVAPTQLSDQKLAFWVRVCNDLLWYCWSPQRTTITFTTISAPRHDVTQLPVQAVGRKASHQYIYRIKKPFAHLQKYSSRFVYLSLSDSHLSRGKYWVPVCCLCDRFLFNIHLPGSWSGSMTLILGSLVTNMASHPNFFSILH